MNSMKVFAVVIFALFIAAACGGGSDSGNGGDNTGEAGGSYSYNNTSQTLTITITSSDFDGDCGPEPGTEDFTVTSLTATTMVWEGSDEEVVTWTRASGTDGDMVGTWTITEDDTTMELVIDGAGNFTLSGTCSDSGSGGGGCQGVSADLNNFLGTWTGPATYTEGSGGGQATITIALSGTDPTTISWTTENTTSTESCVLITDGEARFPLPNADPGDPDCADWDVQAVARLNNDATIMAVTASGFSCNNQLLTMAGDLTKVTQ